MRRALLSLVVVVVALVVQRTILDRVPLPGGAQPDLVLLVVVALALTGGPEPGMITGFLAGLALDVAPPASHIVGVSALVFCVIGYACGKIAAQTDGPWLFYATVAAAAAAVGEGAQAALGKLLSDPEVTWQAVRQVLPASIVYDVILSPFVLALLVTAVRWATGRRARRTEPAVGHPAGAARWLTEDTAAVGAVRQMAGAATPRLRLTEGHAGDGWIGAGHSVGAGRRVGGRREPRLRFDGQRTTGTGSAGGSRIGLGPGGATTPRLRFGGNGRRDGVIAGQTGSPAGLGGAGWSRRTAAPKVRFGAGRRRDGVVGGFVGGSRWTAGPPKVRFGAGRRRDGVVGGSLGGTAAGWRSGGRVPKFRRHRSSGTLGVGGPLTGRAGRWSGSGGPLPRRRRRGAAMWRWIGRSKGGRR